MDEDAATAARVVANKLAGSRGQSITLAVERAILEANNASGSTPDVYVPFGADPELAAFIVASAGACVSLIRAAVGSSKTDRRTDRPNADTLARHVRLNVRKPPTMPDEQRDKIAIDVARATLEN